MNITAPPLTPAEAFFHGANMVFLDAMGSEDQSVAEHRQRITAFIHAQLERQGVNLVLKEYVCQEMNCTDKRLFGIHPFYIEKGAVKFSFWLNIRICFSVYNIPAVIVNTALDWAGYSPPPCP